MSKLSRRSLVTIAAALPALAVPAGSALAGEAGDDAALLRLGKLLDPIERDVYAQSATDAAEDRAFWAEVEVRTGIAWRDRPDRDDTSPEARAYYNVRDEILKALYADDDKDEEGTTRNDRVWGPRAIASTRSANASLRGRQRRSAA